MKLKSPALFIRTVFNKVRIILIAAFFACTNSNTENCLFHKRSTLVRNNQLVQRQSVREAFVGSAFSFQLFHPSTLPISTVGPSVKLINQRTLDSQWGGGPMDRDWDISLPSEHTGSVNCLDPEPCRSDESECMCVRALDPAHAITPQWIGRQ